MKKYFVYFEAETDIGTATGNRVIEADDDVCIESIEDVINIEKSIKEQAKYKHVLLKNIIKLPI